MKGDKEHKRINWDSTLFLTLFHKRSDRRALYVFPVEIGCGFDFRLASRRSERRQSILRLKR